MKDNKVLKAGENENPILTASRDPKNPLGELREITISSQVYDKIMIGSSNMKLVERLPECLAYPMEIWMSESKDIKVIYFIEKKDSDVYNVRMIQKTDLKSNQVEEYVYPQKECKQSLAIIL